MKVLDTTVAVDHLRGDQSAVALLRGLVEADETLAASEVVRCELVAGVRDDEITALEQFFSIVSWSPSARRSGVRPVSSLDADLLTTNVRHFPMLPRLAAPY